MQFIAQPFAEVRLGEFLLAHLADPQWTVFRAAIAFVKRSGTQFIREPLGNFSGRAQARISVGIDLYGTSREGLSDLLEAMPGEHVFVYRNNGPYTFHPKVYLFKSGERADVLVGSGNLTGGGLFTNYEASLAASLNLAVAEDAAFLRIVEATLDVWSQPQQGICYVLTPDFLDQLVGTGLVRSEAQIAQMRRAAAAQEPRLASDTAGTPVLGIPAAPTPAFFTTFAVPPPPAIPSAMSVPQIVIPEPEEEEAEGMAAAAAEAVAETPSLVISILARDLPMVNSSPEVSITKHIRDKQPTFWGWPSQFEGPDNRGQYRRPNIRIRYGGHICDAYLQQYPDQKPDGTKASADFRLGAIAPIVADLRQEDDLILLSRSTEPNVEYLARVVRVGDGEHEALMNGLEVYSRSRSANGTYRKFRYTV
jgi:hypothetical protein